MQASLRVNAPNDQYEQEAERVADTVMRTPVGPGQPEPPSTPDRPSYYIQRSASGAGMSVSPAVEGSISQMQGGGQPLPASERSFFEGRFGHDFSQIRIHADDHAAQTAQSLNARAFTVGTDIAFDAGEYQPGTESGRHLLAHELTHTVQQTGGVATERVQPKAADLEAEAAPEQISADTGLAAPAQTQADHPNLAQNPRPVQRSTEPGTIQRAPKAPGTGASPITEEEKIIGAFGNTHRDLDRNPDEVEARDGRPDDAPIVAQFRLAVVVSTKLIVFGCNGR